MATTTPAERLALISENLAEVLNPEIIEKILNEGGNPKIYWGEHSNTPRMARPATLHTLAEPY